MPSISSSGLAGSVLAAGTKMSCSAARTLVDRLGGSRVWLNSGRWSRSSSSMTRMATSRARSRSTSMAMFSSPCGPPIACGRPTDEASRISIRD